MKPWTFVHVADIQVGSPRSFRFKPAWNENWQTARKQIVRIKPELLLVGGDLTRDGSLHDYELAGIKADLDSLPFPYRVVPGNMDTGNKHTSAQGPLEDRDDVALNVTSDQLRRFESFFGPLPFSVVYRNVRFSGFYGAVAGSGLPEEDRMWRWLEGLKDLPRRDHHVVVMHYALFIDRMEEPNFELTDPQQYKCWYMSIDHPHRDRMLAAFKASGMDLVISGHMHCRKTDFVEGIRFDKAPATCSEQFADYWPDGEATRGFLRYDVSDAGIECTFIPLEKVSTVSGYGPSGHPKPESRDYSQAWEK